MDETELFQIYLFNQRFKSFAGEEGKFLGKRVLRAILCEALCSLCVEKMV